MSDSTLPQPGQMLLGKYEVERVLGQGGMGVVVAARHVVLEEKVAIKFLLPSVAGNPDVVKRFLREAQSAVKIRNEHVARVTDVGTLENGAPYIVMEHLSGVDLGEYVERRGPMPIHDAVECVLQACEALADAHAMGIVHRDIKPANLFLTTRSDGSPCVKILDFGISKVKSTDNQGLTKTQGMMGSPLYMSPEQLTSAKDVDPRADVYALGVVLYELLTAKQPYEADDLPQLIVQVLHNEPTSPRSFRPEIPVDLEQVILGALVKDRNRRYQSVAQLALALVRFGPPRAAVSAERAARITTANGNKSASTPPPAGGGTLVPLGGTKPPTQSSKGPLIAALALGGLVVLGGLGLGAYKLTRPSPSEAATTAPAAAKESTPKSNDGDDDTSKSKPKVEEAKSAPTADPTEKQADPTPTSTAPSTSATTNTVAPTPMKTPTSTTKPKTTTTTTKPSASAKTPKPADDPFGSHVY